MRVALPWPMRLRAAAAFVVWAALAAGALADEHVWTSRGPTDVAWVTDVAIVDGTAYAGTLNGVFRSVDGATTWQSSGLKGQWISQVVGRSGAEPVTDDYPGERPWPFTGGTVKRVVIDVSGQPFVDLAREAAAAFARQ